MRAEGPRARSHGGVRDRDYERLARQLERSEPPHCPYEGCEAHRADARLAGWRPTKRGRYHHRFLRRSIQRWQCPSCGRTFSARAFLLEYRAKRPGLVALVFSLVAESQAMRQVARTLGVSEHLVRRRVRALGSQAVLHLATSLAQLAGRLHGPVEIDGFRSYATSHYETIDLYTLIHTQTGFWLAVSAAVSRRPGKLRPAQAAEKLSRDARLGPPHPRYRRAAALDRLLAQLARLLPPRARTELHSDLEPEIAAAVRRSPLGHRLRHRTVPGSANRALPGHPLARTNREHGLARHVRADHRRRTIAFPKRLYAAVDRIHLHILWRNFLKGVSERSARLRRLTPAILLGLASSVPSPAQLVHRRLFPSIANLPPLLRDAYYASLRARTAERSSPELLFRPA